MFFNNMHIPVLLDESIDGLGIRSGDIVVDGTLGGGDQSWICRTGCTPDSESIV